FSLSRPTRSVESSISPYTLRAVSAVKAILTRNRNAATRTKPATRSRPFRVCPVDRLPSMFVGASIYGEEEFVSPMSSSHPHLKMPTPSASPGGLSFTSLHATRVELDMLVELGPEPPHE